MSNAIFSFDHIHIISREPKISAQLGEMKIIIRGKRPGEKPNSTSPIQHYEEYSSHNEWGTDHFGFIYHEDLIGFCDEIREKGATFAVEPWEFLPGSVICYVSAPDGVSIELIQAK